MVCKNTGHQVIKNSETWETGNKLIFQFIVGEFPEYTSGKGNLGIVQKTLSWEVRAGSMKEAEMARVHRALMGAREHWDMYRGRIPDICTGSPSSLQLSTDMYMNVRKLSDAGKKLHKRIRKNNLCYHTRMGIVPVTTSHMSNLIHRTSEMVLSRGPQEWGKTSPRQNIYLVPPNKVDKQILKELSWPYPRTKLRNTFRNIKISNTKHSKFIMSGTHQKLLCRQRKKIWLIMRKSTNWAQSRIT